MGRPRKPIEKHLLDGTFRSDRHGLPPDDNDAVAPPTKPTDLDGDAGKFWDRVVALLAGIVRDRDAPQLVELCQWWATTQKVRKSLDKSQPGSLRYGRLMNQASTAAATFDRIAKRFGLTPADRATLHVEQTGPVRAKVAVRPKTALDQAGPPAKAKAKVKVKVKPKGK